MEHQPGFTTVLGQSQSQPKPALQPMVAPQAEATRGPESSGSLSGAGKIGFGIGGLFLLGMIGAGVIAFSKPDSSAPPPAAVEQAKTVVPPPAANPTGMFQPVAAAEIDQAVSALIMADAQKEEVRQAVKKNALKLAWIHLSDSEAEDGDWVMITAGGFSQNVRLFKNPLRVAVPYVPGAPIAVTGLIDGDGHGITVAVHSGASTFGLKHLVKGETIQVPSP
jgi:hypothetical protein